MKMNKTCHMECQENPNLPALLHAQGPHMGIKHANYTRLSVQHIVTYSSSSPPGSNIQLYMRQST